MDAALVETHISVVVFFGDHAYKVKKPVRFPFADLTTRPAREALCHREVELNRRLAPDVYEGVADVVGPDGVVRDHLVVMRRMPRDRRLATLVLEGDPRVGPAIEDIADQLARFHAGAERSAAVSAGATSAAIAARWQRNFDQMRPLVGSTFDAEDLGRAEVLARRFLVAREPLFAQRISLGCVCDGHGDLMADDIFVLDDGARILDCVEFDNSLRHVDVVDDLAFLVMDLERLGAADIGHALVEAYETASGRFVPAGLLDHYVAYRAQVRAMVAGLRAAQRSAGDDQHRDRATAEGLLQQCLRRLERGAVRLVLVGGLPGTGKTTVAHGIGEQTGWTVLRSDVVRKQLSGFRPDEPAASGFASGIYTQDWTERTYDELFAVAQPLLALGESVVLDASFVSDRQRLAARELARTNGAELVELRCVVEPEVAAERIRRRMHEQHDASDADPVVAARMAEVADPWPEATEVLTAASVAQVTGDAVQLARAAGRG